MLDQLHGTVCMKTEKSVLYHGENQVVDTAYEAILRGITAKDAVASVGFAFTGGTPVSAGLTTLPSVLARASTRDGTNKPQLVRDSKGRRTAVTWTAVLTPAVAITYDMIGLSTESGLLVAALSLAPVTLAPGESVAVQWTLNLLGAR
jgi:hypothetical protein